MTTRTGRNDAALVLGFPDYRQPAQRMADRAGLPYADIVIHSFPDGESLVRLPVDLPGRVILFGSLDRANRRLVELELAASTALQLGAKRLTLVAPYLGYMRQDIAFRPGEAISQRIIGDLLARHFDALITVDPHLHRTKNLKDAVPVRRAVALSAAPIMAAWLRSHASGPLLIGPDEESGQWVNAIAAPGGLEYGVARKSRRGDRDVSIQLPDMAFPGRHVVLVDDVASTGGTLVEAARQLAAEGAATISVLVTHALFVDDALARLRAVGVDDVCSTDSIQHPTNKLHLDGLLAAALVE
jgi:ribose-phosphate pyrophosphokinase